MKLIGPRSKGVNAIIKRVDAGSARVGSGAGKDPRADCSVGCNWDGSAALAL